MEQQEAQQVGAAPTDEEVHAELAEHDEKTDELDRAANVGVSLSRAAFS